MAKVIFTFEDTDEGMVSHVEFDPPYEVDDYDDLTVAQQTGIQLLNAMQQAGGSLSHTE
jgi:hypothetical protein